MAIQVATAVAADLPELADVAARTFPLACPPSASPDNIAAFIDENLSAGPVRATISPIRTGWCSPHVRMREWWVTSC